MSLHVGGRGPGHLVRTGAFAPGALVALDFQLQEYRVGFGSYYIRDLNALTGWSFTRASTGYALNSAGALVSFGSGVPRLTDLGLLIEESRTNLLLWSQAIDNAAWFKGTATVVADSATAPDGTLTADIVTFTGGPGANQNFQQAATTVNGSVYTLSIWLQGSGTVTLDSPGVGGSHVLTLTAAWQRFSFQYTATSTSTTLRIISSPTNTATGVTVWGAEIELGTFATSYIPTTSATVTRAADVASLTTTFPPQGSIIASYRSPNLSGLRNELWSFLDAGNSRLAVRSNSPNGFEPTAAIGNGTTVIDFSNSATPAVGTLVKVGLAYSTTAAVAGYAVNGVDQTSTGSAIQAVAATMTGPLYIGSITGTTNYHNDFVRTFTVYPTVYTAAQLQGLTQ